MAFLNLVPLPKGSIYLALLLCTAIASNVPRARAGQNPVLIIDTFTHGGRNDLDAWHGSGENMPMVWADGYVELSPTNADQNFHTQLTSTCFDLTPFKDMYLHIVCEGASHFTISITQTNSQCDAFKNPYPETWDDIEARRYQQGNDIYIPISHFNIDYTRALSVSFKGFYLPEKLKVSKVEITATRPRTFPAPEKLPTGTLWLRCKRPNSFAFGIDDGSPALGRQMLDILTSEGINATFFTVGNGLAVLNSGWTDLYRDMAARGHQVALHTWSHPPMEELKTDAEIDDEIVKNLQIMREKLGIDSRYFRPPYGILGARTRQRLAWFIKDPQIINWSVDIEDWLWAGSPTPEKQVKAFQRDVDKGGDLVVMHFISEDTVKYTRDVIDIARKTGKRIMRVDQCMEDPEAPPLD
ncbi:polysaccharide deacetylase [Blastomyces gilchristii SLH14081]|uniref:Polysaccharide deacetylase n=1 Tax=Blastomyces gilchristii (strain SLH14081) TaxID=559298 RepID=A0A179U914_BLAGS|nr:polysaccharide deacetylase [Blastomyces gilchristii SLH14081]OAT04223.1 polysaccharide deacetylase [Blastomyces gilchristii SLH14081]